MDATLRVGKLGPRLILIQAWTRNVAMTGNTTTEQTFSAQIRNTLRLPDTQTEATPPVL